ncbi:antibiotic biosynthesis monooxygenase family protein [Sphingosinicella rhizophila]|uniref:Antibiotic biosynthesis monooxygenase n=1 Tax=Sphingosinicella rhizophila TaxID=3050082 RepID=A0ABU3Q6C0_9SPHN|nr:antibiotic biosynthesis monooxygenase [Sphingosinicella sp. GR2756]MDT9598951.1 antibiotic biosynthesis monooxygenase [Sphingosinicella sp. GR2756]
MILRIWRGYADPSRPDDYPDHFRNAVVPELGTIAGFVGAELTRQVLPERIIFTVISRWQTMEAVKAFAGEDIGRAVVHPAAAATLAGFDDEVEHHEVIVRS